MDDFFDGCLGATARLAERDRIVEYQRCVLPSGQASAIEVEDAADWAPISRTAPSAVKPPLQEMWRPTSRPSAASDAPLPPAS